jgi:hypothetical protein
VSDERRQLVLGIAEPPGFNAESLRTALDRRGVTRVRSLPTAGRLQVEYDPRLIDVTAIQNALQAIGFRSWVVAAPTPAAESGRDD